MRLITTSATFDTATWTAPGARLYDGLESWDGYWYAGEVEHCGGGPDATQKKQEEAQANLTNQEAAAAQRAEAFKEQQQARVNPFYGNLMDNGPEYTPALLDYEGGVNARAFAPEKANLVRRLGSDTGLPSGYRDQALTDFEERRAGGYDSGLTNILTDRQAAKERGAAGLMGQAQLADPTALYSGATAGNNAIFNAPRSPGLAGTLGALLGGAAQIGGSYLSQQRRNPSNPNSPSMTGVYGDGTGWSD
jgi:hypothetical protein